MNEVVVMQDVFCSGLGAVERLEGNCLRLYFYVSQSLDNGPRQRLVVAKLVVPESAMPEAMLQLVRAAGDTEKLISLVPELMH
jgi:hypothetical protein